MIIWADWQIILQLFKRSLDFIIRRFEVSIYLDGIIKVPVFKLNNFTQDIMKDRQ